MNLKKILLVATSLSMSIGILAGCGGAKETADKVKEYSTITMVWYPNESGGDLEEARNEIGNIVEKATGKKVEHKLTTDYAIAIEAIANDTAQLAFMGAQGYVEAHNKNQNIVPVAVPSGKSGTLDDAVYYSWLSVNKADEDKYKSGNDYSIEGIEGKKMSFVSNSSTSGFKVPTKAIVQEFSKNDKYKDLKQEDLMEGGNNKFFSEVIYGGSHQGSAVNLLTGKAEVAAFCDTVLVNYVEAAQGEFNKTGTTYKVKADAGDPFNNLVGKEFTVIKSTPVLNSPFAMNKSLLTDGDQKAIIDAFLSDETANNSKVFLPKDSKEKGLFKKEGNEKFLMVEDSWFNPVRELSK